MIQKNKLFAAFDMYVLMETTKRANGPCALKYNSFLTLSK